MTPEQQERTERAIASIEASVAYFQSRYFQGVIAAALSSAVASAGSPWVDRASAAAYCRCSASEIDRAADAGVFPRYQRGGTPLFRKAELDAAILEGRWRKRGELQAA